MPEFSEVGWNGLSLLAAILAVPLLVFLNGFFVAAEFSLVAIRRTKVKDLIASGTPGAGLVEKTLANLDQTIAATQLGITLASIGLGFVCEPAFAVIIEPVFQKLTPFAQKLTIHSISTGVAFALVTFLHVVFGELIPKTLALQNPVRTSLFASGPILLFTAVAYPFIHIMNGTAAWIIRLFGWENKDSPTLAHSISELQLLIEDTEEAGILEPDQAEYLQNLFLLPSKKVKACLVPKEKMSVLELHTPIEVVLEKVRQGGHTRMPVYEDNPDNYVGILNTKDLLYFFTTHGVAVLQDALYPLLFLKPDESLANALRLFRKTHRHMALVRDTEGKVVGMITLEDVLEQIVGEIEDEHDQPRVWRISKTHFKKK
ncbi:MAG: HlyC/CorC family transporter [Gemmataceae bacterium]|nr:HlyC/CorC family transporter [Gemmataceae bacterium]